MKKYAFLGLSIGVAIMSIVTWLNSFFPFKLMAYELFWTSTILLFLACGTIAYLYFMNGREERHTRFIFGILLIISAASMYHGYEYTLTDLESQKFIQSRFSEFALSMTIFLTTIKNIIGFGIAAIGAGVVTNSLNELRIES